MRKSICAMPRRADMTRAAFRNYYETRHAPLALPYFPFRRYVRNHLLDHKDVGFDTLSEFWVANPDVITALMEGPVGDLFREDERQFTDQPQIAPAGCEEHMLGSGSSGPRPRTALLLRRPEATDIATFRMDLLEWARHLALSNAGVSVDLVTSWRSPPFPADAVVWLEGHARIAAAPASLSLWRCLKVEAVETPPDQLLKD